MLLVSRSAHAIGTSENGSMPAGTLILESLSATGILGRLEVMSQRRVDVESASGESRAWTIVKFGIGDVAPEEVAADLQSSLQPGPWYVDFRHAGRVYVVFASGRFDYELGDAAAHDLAVTHARRIGIPEEQIDWSWRPVTGAIGDEPVLGPASA